MQHKKWRKMVCCLNYSYVMYNLLSRLYGDFHNHINIFNAFFNCELYYTEDGRYIKADGTNLNTYLSGMHLRKRNPWTVFVRFLDTGEFLDNQYGKPTAERFKEIVTANGRWKMTAKQETEFRDCIRKCIEECFDNGYADFVGKEKLLELNGSSWKDDIYTFVFKLIENTLRWGCNNDLRKIGDSEKAEIMLDALNCCDQHSVDMILLHKMDDIYL